MEKDENNKLELEFTESFNKTYWAFNVPLQMWKTKNGHTAINYMPRKQMCRDLDEVVTKEEMPTYCKNAAKVLRNLATLFDAMAEGKIDTIYYPDETLDEAIKKKGEQC